ncbi:MAG: Tat pathway signal sequence domain protein [Geminicoccaceae bacterium]
MQQFACAPWLRRSTAALGAAVGFMLAGPPLSAADGQLMIELNKLEDTDEGCRSLFLFGNETGHELSRFRVDLILFDPEGVYAKQLLLDMAPLYDDKKVLASFVLADAPCASIGSILVNDLPWCENGAGTKLDCVPLLAVESRTDVPLER